MVNFHGELVLRVREGVLFLWHEEVLCPEPRTPGAGDSRRYRWDPDRRWTCTQGCEPARLATTPVWRWFCLVRSAARVVRHACMRRKDQALIPTLRSGYAEPFQRRIKLGHGFDVRNSKAGDNRLVRFRRATTEEQFHLSRQ